jgi:hypothetical protein
MNSFKKMSIVLAAALSIGTLSAITANAAVNADTLSIDNPTSVVTTGESATAVITVTFLAQGVNDTVTVTSSVTALPAGIAKFATLSVQETSSSVVVLGSGNYSADVASTSNSAAYVTAKLKATLDTPSVAGTYVFKFTPSLKSGVLGAVNALPVTWTVTVAPKTLGWKTAFIGAYSNGTTDTATADSAISVSSSASVTPKARLDVAQGYGATAGSDVATAADAQSVVVTTDKGLVSKTNDYTAGAKSVTTLAGTEARGDYYVFSNGDVGVANITITVNGSLFATKTVTLKGPASGLVATLGTGQPAYVTVSDSQTTVISATDIALSAVDNPAGLTVVSSDTSVATVSITGNNAVRVTGVKAGTATITVTDPATTGAAKAVSFPVRVAPARSKSAPEITFDKSAYNVGELVTMTISADMGDKASANLFSTALTFSSTVVATGTAPTGTTHAIKGGKVIYTFYAPAVSGTFTVAGATGTDIDVPTVVAVTKTVSILNAAVDAATDAANEAAQAASDATDAALSAADAADAATAKAQEAVDAVAKLSSEVSALIASLKKQITTLTALVVKIQKKVKA